MNDKQFRELLGYLSLSWEGYQKVRKGVKKKIQRHMQQLGCRNISEYIKVLEWNSDVRQQTDTLMMVTISRFFRDRMVWENLEKILLPEMIDIFTEKINVWCAGCACGEEAYSFRILWESLQMQDRPIPVLMLLATDANPTCLARAEAGRYPGSSLKEVPNGIRSAFFCTKKSGKQFNLNSKIRSGVRFRQHILLSDPPEDKFQIIFMRNNLLTYYQDQIKIPVLKKIVSHLEPTGLLIIGSHEKMPPGFENLVLRYPAIYQLF